jgi:hypothetical protein
VKYTPEKIVADVEKVQRRNVNVSSLLCDFISLINFVTILDPLVPVDTRFFEVL